MSVQRRLLLVLLAAVVVAGLFFFVQLGSDENDEGSSSSDSSASASPDEDIDPEVEAILTKGVEYAAAQDSVTVSSPASGQIGATEFSFVGDSMTGSFESSGILLELLSVEGVAYVRAPAEFWSSATSDQAAIASLAGKWVPIEAGGQALASLLEFTDRSAFLAGLLSPRADSSATGESELDGVETDTVTIGSGAQSTVLHFDRETGAPVGFVASDIVSTFDFAPVEAPTKPADADIVDPSLLGQ